MVVIISLYFKASNTSKGLWNVEDIIREDKQTTSGSLETNADTDVDTPPEKFEPSKTVHPEPSEEEKHKIKELIDRIEKLQKRIRC